MIYLAESMEQREKGVRLLDESSNLYRIASESQSMSELLDFTLEALNKDLEALSLIWEATMMQKRAVEELRDEWENELGDFEKELFVNLQI